MNVLLKAKKAFETIHQNGCEYFGTINFGVYDVNYKNCVISFKNYDTCLEIEAEDRLD